MATPKTEKKVVKKPAAAPKAAPKAPAAAKPVKAAPKAPVAEKAVVAKVEKPAAKVVAPKAEKPAAKKPKVAKVSKGTPVSHGVGRRKACVARVWLRRNGDGKITVNNLDVNTYFDTTLTRASASSPFKVYPMGSMYNVDVNVSGGGKVGQADAVKLAIARAFLEQDETLRPVLRKAGMLTVDSRVKERKKYGQKAARRKFQFVKR